MSTDALEATPALLDQVLDDCASSRLLLVSDDRALCERVEARGGQCLSAEAAQPERLTELTAELAILDAEAALPRETATALVSRLRDIHAERVIVIAAESQGAALSRHALIGLGFHRRAVSADGDVRRRWYEFDMAHYKVTPDWLNARNWANPELWDKYRW